MTVVPVLVSDCRSLEPRPALAGTPPQLILGAGRLLCATHGRASPAGQEGQARTSPRGPTRPDPGSARAGAASRVRRRGFAGWRPSSTGYRRWPRCRSSHPSTSRSLSLPSLSCCSPGAAAPPPPLLLSAHAHVPECLVRELGGGEGWCWVRGRCSTTARLRRQRQTWQDKRAWWQSAGQVPVKPSVRAMT